MWNRQYLGRLANEYGMKSDDYEKRVFVEHFLRLVWGQNGRFLRGQQGQCSNKDIQWLEVTDKTSIVSDVMCILRQIRKRREHRERKVWQELHETIQKLQRVESSISRIQDTVKACLNTQAATATEDELASCIATRHLTLTKARKILKQVESLERTVLACYETIDA